MEQSLISLERMRTFVRVAERGNLAAVARENDPRKNQVRRLVADGRYYVCGGYRNLLRYPIRLDDF